MGFVGKTAQNPLPLPLRYDYRPLRADEQNGKLLDDVYYLLSSSQQNFFMQAHLQLAYGIFLTADGLVVDQVLSYRKSLKCCLKVAATRVGFSFSALRKRSKCVLKFRSE